MSTNLQKGGAEGEDDKPGSEQQPGTSASFQGAPEGLRDSDLDISSDGAQNPGQGQPGVGTVKVRNVLRGRPPLETGEKKRPRISDASEQEGAGDDVHMETDSADSDNDGDEGDGNAERNLVMDVVDSDQPESLPVQDVAETSHSSRPQPLLQASRRSSSNAEENVSTTMQSSSPRHRPSVSGDPASFRYKMDTAIASTSAAAMAPPLSRLMEESPLLDDMYNLPARRESVDRDRSSNREPTPLAANMDPLYFQRGGEVDLNENKGPDAFLDKMQGTQRLMWARKLFFLSTELVFPGFTAYSDNKNQVPDYMGCVRVRSSCMMQALLYADSLFFIAWVLSFLSTCDILITVIKELHGYLSICLTCLFIVVNILRLRFGLKGNENDEVQYLALFWMTTVIVQIPLFIFIFLTDLFCPVLLAFTVTMDGFMMAFILLESIIGFIHFRSLLRDELNIIRMARRSKETGQSRANLSTAAPSAASVSGGGSSNVIDLSRGLPTEDASSSEDDEVDNGNDQIGRNQMDFQMHIRRLSETHRQGQHQQDIEEEERDSEDSNSDSSEQVTSTSDTNVRRRPIIAH